jgi:hypothetical protein
MKHIKETSQFGHLMRDLEKCRRMDEEEISQSINDLMSLIYSLLKLDKEEERERDVSSRFIVHELLMYKPTSRLLMGSQV